MVKVGKKEKLLFGALFIRIIILWVIIVITPEWSAGLVSNNIRQDDVRYEMGAMLYAKTAESLIDYEAFRSAYLFYGDNTGLKKNIFSATPLWYWIVCLIYYCFHEMLAIRLFNIIISVASVSILYELTKLLYKEETAYAAAKLLAFLPYPVIFSCFSYKDNLIMALILQLLYYALSYRIKNEISFRRGAGIIVVCLSLLLLRGGMSAILLVLCLAIACFKDDAIATRKKAIRRLVSVLLAICVSGLIIISNREEIIVRANAYIFGKNVLELGMISLVTITSFEDLYKLPLTYLFAIIMPIGNAGDTNSWYRIIGILNICMAPIAIGAFLDIFIQKKSEWIFVGCCLICYMISIISSIGISRHYYSLLFIPIILASHLKYYGNGFLKSLWCTGSILYSIIIFCYLLQQNLK